MIYTIEWAHVPMNTNFLLNQFQINKNYILHAFLLYFRGKFGEEITRIQVNIA